MQNNHEEPFRKTQEIQTVLQQPMLQESRKWLISSTETYAEKSAQNRIHVDQDGNIGLKYL